MCAARRASPNCAAGKGSPRAFITGLYYSRSKEFLEAGEKCLAGDTARDTTSDEVKALRREAMALKEVVADLTLENRLLKKDDRDSGDPE